MFLALDELRRMAGGEAMTSWGKPEPRPTDPLKWEWVRAMERVHRMKKDNAPPDAIARAEIERDAAGDRWEAAEIALAEQDVSKQ